MKNNEYIELWGYKIFRNGRIIGLLGTDLTINNPTDLVKIRIGNKLTYIPVMKLIYYAFNQNFDYTDNSLQVIQKVKNKDISLENLFLVTKSSIFHGENNVNAKLTDKQVEEIITKYEKAQDKKLDKNNPMKKVSYRSLAEEYNVSHSLISGIIKGRFRNIENYRIK